MKILRVGRLKFHGDDEFTDRIELELNDVKYVLTKDIAGGIRINCTGDESTIMVKPGCANEIIVIGT